MKTLYLKSQVEMIATNGKASGQKAQAILAYLELIKQHPHMDDEDGQIMMDRMEKELADMILAGQ